VPVTAPLLQRVGFTDHAIERFATRAGLAVTTRSVIEPIVRDLLLLEGRVVTERPRWARSRNVADLYLQLGEWMLFIGCRRESGSERPRYSIVTSIAGGTRTTWRVARRRGYVHTPAPEPLCRRRPPRVSLTVSTAIAIRDRRAGKRREHLLGAIKTTHRARQQHARAEFEREVASAWHQTTRVP
jgi:hypothetical protein